MDNVEVVVVNKKEKYVAFVFIAFVMIVTTLAIAVRAEPKIVSYNFTLVINRGEQINTTTCGTNGTNVSGPSFYQAGNVSLYNTDFNITLPAQNEHQSTRNFLTIRDIPSNCQTDDILSLLVNTTQAVANSSLITYQSQQQIFRVYNETSIYVDKFAECREVNGQVSVREVTCKADLEECKLTRTNTTAELAISNTNLQQKNNDITNIQAASQTAQSELQKCRTDLATKGAMGGYLFVALAGFGVGYFIFKKDNNPPDIADFPQA